jgi:hypothetical protein
VRVKLRTVCVDLNPRGRWEVALPDRAGRVTCETLEEARRVAHRHAEQAHPCQLIVHDAYHRVVDRELISAGPQPALMRDPNS